MKSCLIMRVKQVSCKHALNGKKTHNIRGFHIQINPTLPQYGTKHHTGEEGQGLGLKDDQLSIQTPLFCLVNTKKLCVSYI